MCLSACYKLLFLLLVCRNNCSGHGYCDRHTKMCVCESFWMQDFLKVHFGTKESNCGKRSIFYVFPDIRESNAYTAISKKVVGKSARDNPERYCGWF